MALEIAIFYSGSGTPVATLERLSDGYFWDQNTDTAWEAAPSFADKKITLTEGTGEDVDSWTASVASLGSPGTVRVRIHDDDDSDKVIAIAETRPILSDNEIDVGNVEYWNATAVNSPDTAGYPVVTIKDGTGQGELNLASGVVDANVTKWSGTAVASVDTAGYPVVTVKDGTGQGELNLALGVVDANVMRFLGTLIVETSAGNIAANFDNFYDNADAVTTKTVDDVGGSGASVLRSGTAQAGASATITLDAAASATNDIFNGCMVQITGGTGAGQSRLITDYVGSTKVATVGHAWTTNPDATSTFEILPAARAVLDATGLDNVVIETGVNARQAVSVIAAACVAEASGLDTTSATFKAADNAGTTRIAATVDEHGNRSAITLTLPS